MASLPQIRLLTNGAADWRQVAMALKRSKTLEASSDGKRLRRKTRYEGPGAKAKPKAAGTNPPWWWCWMFCDLTTDWCPGCLQARVARPVHRPSRLQQQQLHQRCLAARQPMMALKQQMRRWRAQIWRMT